jgi:hypothetical protein
MYEPPRTARSTSLEDTWEFVQEGVDIIMALLNQGLTYKRYMEIYT